jgi:hypothetical protein
MYISVSIINQDSAWLGFAYTWDLILDRCESVYNRDGDRLRQIWDYYNIIQLMNQILSLSLSGLKNAIKVSNNKRIFYRPFKQKQYYIYFIHEPKLSLYSSQFVFVQKYTMVLFYKKNTFQWQLKNTIVKNIMKYWNNLQTETILWSLQFKISSSFSFFKQKWKINTLYFVH